MMNVERTPSDEAALHACRIEPISTLGPERDIIQLIELLIGCVAQGASIGFLAPLSFGDAEAYWKKIAADLPGKNRLLLVARDGASRTIVGSAQIVFETRANGRHRAEVQKVMVHPAQRRRGIASLLMREIEAAARARGVTLLFLDTSDSHAGARPFYETLRYVYVGGIPGYALDPQGKPEQNAIYYKTLAPDR